MTEYLQKFPEIVLGGQRLVWDSRQPMTANERVYLTRENVSHHEILKQRAQSGPKGILNKILIDATSDANKHQLGRDAAQALSHPSRAMRIYGVTGTNGKTTTVHLMRHFFMSRVGSVAQLGTEGLRIYRNGKLVHHEDSGWTTPPAPNLQALLAHLRDEGVEVFVCELSSHASALGRHGGLDCDGLVFTNLSQDHLDFHGTMENYFQAKRDLFEPCLEHKRGLAVVNTGSPWGLRLSTELGLHVRLKTFNCETDLQGFLQDTSGMRFECSSIPFRSTLVGRYNAENIVGAAMVVGAFDQPHSHNELDFSVDIPGRLERVDLGQNRVAFVDYAHTPDALERVLFTLREVVGEQPLWVVFGCGGDRDQGKRPQMGAIAERLADRVIVTTDNPRTESPAQIIAQILSGVSNPLGGKVLVEPDRARAIQQAKQNLPSRGVLIVAGKGHENYQIVGHDKRPFSDCAELLK